MSKFKFKFFFLIFFPTSLIIVRGLAFLGYPPQTLAGLSPLSCPLKLFLGLNCPTCGLTRSLVYAWNGDYGISLRYHFGGIGILVLALMCYGLLLANQQANLIYYWQSIKSKPVSRVFFIVIIFLYSFWGFFLKSNI